MLKINRGGVLVGPWAILVPEIIENEYNSVFSIETSCNLPSIRLKSFHWGGLIGPWT